MIVKSLIRYPDGSMCIVIDDVDAESFSVINHSCATKAECSMVPGVPVTLEKMIKLGIVGEPVPDIDLKGPAWHAACRAARFRLREYGLEAQMSRHDFKRFWHDLRQAIRKEYFYNA